MCKVYFTARIMLARKNYIIFELLTVLSALLSSSSCSPFLQNAPSALINFVASASSSASSFRSQPYTNIADLRRRHEKVEQLQSKYTGEEYMDNLTPEEEMNTNEVTPNIIQKKIGKILTKLKLISEISNIFFPNNENAKNDSSVAIDEENELVSDKDHVEITTINTVTSSEIKKDVEEIPEKTFQKTIYHKSSDEPPIRFTLDIGRTQENEGEKTVDDRNVEEQKNPFGQVGIFLAEVLGSIVALTYGAAIQLNHFIEGAKDPSNA